MKDPIVESLEDSMKELAPEYIEHRKQELILLEKLFQNLDFLGIEKIAHKIKGNALSYGFPKYGKLGDKLELSAKAKKRAEIKALLKKMKLFLEAYCAPTKN